ncbi:MAG: DmsE family decaheme c-type cytochrome [Acidobacteriaceae bacterium]|nr:DmsE family decaheme c-type cytochrome [Acidobacteriaceae bacterium]
MRRKLFVATCLVSLLVVAGSRTVHAAPGVPQQSVVSHPNATAPSADQFVGAETCETCHADVAKKFSDNPHTRLALEHAGKGVTCESCHGPGKAHVDAGGDATKIFQFSKASPRVIDQKCLTCHAGTHPNFEHTAHGEGNIDCLSCHSIHKSIAETSLLTQPQPKLCYTCHTDIKAAFAQPFHHKVDEGLMKCNDCHDPHGTFTGTLQRPGTMLHKGPGGDVVCTKCHTETAGPFVYPHPVIPTEGCGACHYPHGSPNPRLLTRANVNQLCLQCHTASMNFTAPGIPSFHNQANQYQACTVCHSQIHGSNSDFVFFK